MNKAVPWNVNGVGFDAREAAREAARRQGKSLGEWLHGVISDHAANLGVEEHEIADRQKVDAITSKLERLSARSGDQDRKASVDRGSEFAARRAGRDRDEDLEERVVRRRRSAAVEETEFLLEEAIDTMERRALRAERHTDDALRSFTRLLERNEANRERERESVTVMAQKLSEIETRLSDRMAQADDNPIKSALARLETRLEAIGRRGSAEAAVKPKAAAAAPEPMQRFEEKLNSILDALNRPSQVSSVALASHAAHRDVSGSRKDRRLGDAIAEIATRQQTLDDPDAPVFVGRVRTQRRDSAPPVPAPAPLEAPFTAMQGEIAALATTIENLRLDVAQQRRGDVASFEPTPPLFGRDQDFPEDDLRALLGGRSGALTKIEDRLDGLAAKIDQAVAGRRDASVDLPPPAAASGESQALEAMLRDLTRKMDAVQAPDADNHALEALQQQLGLLSARFERSGEGLAKLTSLEASMRDLFTHLEETRASVETSASRAAREVLRIALEEGRAQNDHGTASGLAAMHALHEEAESRTTSTLSAVQGTLEKVVDRLAVMETEIDRSRKTSPRAPEIPAATRRGPKVDMSLGAPDPLFDQPRMSAPKVEARAKDSDGPFDLDQESSRSDFIAAARRAAKVAQSDPAFAELKRPAAKAPAEVRAGLVAQSRDYIEKHKRPVLLSLAAIFVIVGTMAVLQKIGLGDDSDARLAANFSPARVVTAAAPRPAPARASQMAELSPSALPRSTPALANPIPGSDPIQTGSIPSLPAFAAGAAPSRPVRPALSPNLISAAEQGDGAAEYALGVQYADGTTAPRDFTQAAKWLQKAAAQNLAPAKYRLAALYEKGLGVPQDKLKARALYLQAAEVGNPRAMHNLAVLLADGDGKPDYDGAATWFRKAAQYGVHDSQYNLAILLARGIGVQQSLVQSYQWFAIAAAQGDQDAGKKRDEVATKLGANDLAVAKALAASFRPRVADAVATQVQPPPGGWDGASTASPLNSAGAKISSL